jgi:threonine/homoserine/homoserine lactone efflux protein
VGKGISEVLIYGVGVAISVAPIIAVVLMLFSQRARVNGPLFLLGWVTALASVSIIAYVVANQNNAATSTETSDTISWGHIVLGVVLLLLAARNWRNRPAAGTEAPMPKWMASVDDLSPGKAFGLGLLLDGANPKNLILTIAAVTGLAQLGPSVSEAVVALAVFVVIGSLTIAGPVIYYFLGGDHAKAALDELKDWLRLHNVAVMAVVFLILGVDLIAKGIPPLSG